MILEKYCSEIRRAVVYDPDVPDTINVATTLASMHDGLARTHNLSV